MLGGDRNGGRRGGPPSSGGRHREVQVSHSARVENAAGMLPSACHSHLICWGVRRELDERSRGRVLRPWCIGRGLQLAFEREPCRARLAELPTLHEPVQSEHYHTHGLDKKQE